MKRAIIQDLGTLKTRLVPHLRGAQLAVVFGSVARGDADEWSDLDLMIVADTTRPAQVFSHGQAAEAIGQAATFLERAGATIG